VYLFLGGDYMPENMINKEVKLKMGLLVLLIAALVISTGVIGFLISKNDSEIIISKSSNEGATNSEVVVTPQAAPAPTIEDNTEKIQVYVVGEVNKPGVVTLKKGQIIDDAIKAAGGPTDKADLENINLAYILNENVMLKVLPKKEETSDAIESGKEPNSDVASQNERTTGIEIRSDSGGAVLSENEQKSESKGKININKATEAELETLPGVGPSTASKIVAFRNQNGNFKKIEDIMNVPGIGESKFSSMKDLICVD
jgi:competence protein ComEA